MAGRPVYQCSALERLVGAARAVTDDPVERFRLLDRQVPDQLALDGDLDTRAGVVVAHQVSACLNTELFLAPAAAQLVQVILIGALAYDLNAILARARDKRNRRFHYLFLGIALSENDLQRR